MTALDRQLGQFANLIDALPRRSQAALFWAASEVYAESASWKLTEREEMHTLLVAAQDAAYGYCLGRSAEDQASSLLEELNRPLPENSVAQSSWLCADAALRIIADSTFEAGMSVEYVLEPVIGRVSEELFGFWQVGSGEAEELQVAEIMTHSAVVGAVEFCGWAIAELAHSGLPSADVLAAVRARAEVLAASAR